jgi:CRISPR-associated protein Cas2
MLDIDYKIMRLFVFFDLPVETPKERKIYAKFRKNLIEDGFFMLQYSVYVRYCHNNSDSDKHIAHVESFCPETGSVRILKVTESQFVSMLVLTGERSEREKIEGDKEMIIVD